MEATGDASRCDLHVHSVHSGPVDLPVLGRFGNECYSEPEAVYEAAKRRGMSLVTLTDHDSIDGALRLAHLPDVFVSEEVTCVLPEAVPFTWGCWTSPRRSMRPSRIAVGTRQPSLPTWPNMRFPQW